MLGNAPEGLEQLREVVPRLLRAEGPRARAVLAHVELLHPATLDAGQVLEGVAHRLALEGVDEVVLELCGLVGRAAVGGGAHPHRGAAVGEDVLVGVLAEVDVAAVVALLADDLEREGG